MLTVFNRRFVRTITILCAILVGLTAHTPVALADPDEKIPSVLDVLDTAVTGYNNAKGRLDASVQRQTTLESDLKKTELELELLYAEVGTTSAAAYRGSNISTLNVLLDSESPESFLDGMTIMRYMTARDDRLLRTFKNAKRTYEQQKKTIADEIKTQKNELAVMEKQKKAAQAALKKAGGGQLSPGYVPGKATATQAPRNADGSWPKQSATKDDPTTSGKITARTLHAYQQVRAAGFSRYVSCYRMDDHGEHPKGRACDFSSAEKSFLNSRATGDDKVYGDKLTGWLIGNTDRLGILYIIWWNQIWFPGSGWRSYNSGNGTPSGDHYNHIHLSMQ
ncbi:MAG: hypothetical protein JXA67_22560 [Micromonosporaceae bacterium]|nr:hypothetical protein [Micromonosporaceae bacterium]